MELYPWRLKVTEGEIFDLNQLLKRCLQQESGALLFSVPSNQPHVVPQTVIDNSVCEKGHAERQILIPDAFSLKSSKWKLGKGKLKTANKAGKNYLQIEHCSFQ